MDGDGRTAVDHFERAARLDPISPLRDVARAHIAVGLVFQGALEDAVRVFRTTSHRTPRMRLILVGAWGKLNQLAQAREELALYEQTTTISPEAMVEHMAKRNPEQSAWVAETLARLRSGD